MKTRRVINIVNPIKDVQMWTHLTDKEWIEFKVKLIYMDRTIAKWFEEKVREVIK